MKEFIKKVPIAFGAINIIAICILFVWSKIESIKTKKLISEFNEKIQKGELIPRDSVKLHIGGFIVFKKDQHIFALKILNLKATSIDYFEANFECFSQRVSTKRVIDKSADHTQGNVRKLFQKKKDHEYYEDNSIPDRRI